MNNKERSIERSAPLYQQAYEVLKGKILRGEFRPGSTVSETLLAEMLGVSRTPVREALRQLEKDGLVAISRFEVVIAKPSREEFVELYLCRAALEQLVAQRAAESADDKAREDMAEALNDAKRAWEKGDGPGILSANTRFHDRMVESAGIARLSQMMDSLRGPILLARRVVLSAGPEDAREILSEHEGLLMGINAHDPGITQDRMKSHMENDIRRGLAQFEAL